jgi:hypothetical protein
MEYSSSFSPGDQSKHDVTGIRDPCLLDESLDANKDPLMMLDAVESAAHLDLRLWCWFGQASMSTRSVRASSARRVA